MTAYTTFGATTWMVTAPRESLMCLGSGDIRSPDKAYPRVSWHSTTGTPRFQALPHRRTCATIGPDARSMPELWGASQRARAGHARDVLVLRRFEQGAVDEDVGGDDSGGVDAARAVDAADAAQRAHTAGPALPRST